MAMVDMLKQHGDGAWWTDTLKSGIKFHNGNPRASRITTLSWINAADDSLLLVGSDDGMVRVWQRLVRMSEHF